MASGSLSKAADTQKLCGVLDPVEGGDAIHGDIGRLERWLVQTSWSLLKTLLRLNIVLQLT